MLWLFQSNIAKSHFYVWYLGSKETDGVRGSAIVLPIMRQLLKDSLKKAPNKATVQISSKGLKLIQTVPTISRKGRMKMQVAKFHIAASCITYSMVGKAPFDDVVAVVMLVLNPEMNSPIHVHCYRCDGSEAAQIMHANIQLLISRPDVQRSIVDLEQRLFLAGLVVPRPRPAPRSSSHSSQPIVSNDLEHHLARSRTRIFPESSTKMRQESRKDVQQQVVEELKSKLNKNELRTMRNSLQSLDLEDNSPSLADRAQLNPPYRLFGDTILRGSKSRSLENLTDSTVSTDQRGGDNPSVHRFSRLELPFGCCRKETVGHRNSPIRRMSSIHMNL